MILQYEDNQIQQLMKNVIVYPIVPNGFADHYPY